MSIKYYVLTFQKRKLCIKFTKKCFNKYVNLLIKQVTLYNIYLNYKIGNNLLIEK